MLGKGDVGVRFRVSCRMSDTGEKGAGAPTFRKRKKKSVQSQKKPIASVIDDHDEEIGADVSDIQVKHRLRTRASGIDATRVYEQDEKAPTTKADEVKYGLKKSAVVPEEPEEDEVSAALGSNFTNERNYTSALEKKMQEYIEEEMQKKGYVKDKDKAIVNEQIAQGDALSVEEARKLEEKELYTIPEHLNFGGRLRGGAEGLTSERFTTGAVEEELPMEYRLANIQRTQQALDAKRKKSNPAQHMNAKKQYVMDAMQEGKLVSTEEEEKIREKNREHKRRKRESSLKDDYSHVYKEYKELVGGVDSARLLSTSSRWTEGHVMDDRVLGVGVQDDVMEPLEEPEAKRRDAAPAYKQYGAGKGQATDKAVYERYKRQFLTNESRR